MDLRVRWRNFFLYARTLIMTTRLLLLHWKSALSWYEASHLFSAGKHDYLITNYTDLYHFCFLSHIHIALITNHDSYRGGR